MRLDVVAVLELSCLERIALARDASCGCERAANSLAGAAHDDFAAVRFHHQRTLAAHSLGHHGDESEAELRADQRKCDARRTARCFDDQRSSAYLAVSQ